MQNGKNQFDAEAFSKVRNTSRIELNFFSTCLVNAVGLLLASFTNSGISFNNPFSFVALLCVIWLLNWIVRPVLVLFTLPFIILSFGFGMLVINAVVIYLSAWFVPGIEIGSFWNALWASVLVSAAMWVNVYFRSEQMIRDIRRNRKNGGDDDDKTIDV